ncbi:GuaB3 family IMP dehydrogenase-related protein [Corynebacterium choanae]|uniref:Putative oxidoreductase n=1 Tax=Corynebacterium choanae TaxID=1862358 RepID=A0A3G6J804_9CORY|nr:GuaB3 family IMP dehydrogenase-related protein [Corynebacterium choanae]AZA14241.1 putative oxidoreductase [Corynebacterium choanae]
MREHVEIGQGRQALRHYELADVAIVPTRRTRSSKDVDTTWHIDAYHFDVPLIAHPTDALVDIPFAAEFQRLGGLAPLNVEGLWGRHANAEEELAALADVANTDPQAAMRKLRELHAAPLNVELISERIAKMRDSGMTVAVRVTPQQARELAPVVVKAGAEILFIQGTVISAEHVATDGQPLNLKEFIGTLDVPVICGGVYDYTTALHLMRTGAAGVIVGGGENLQAASMGIGVGMATAIADVAAARRDYLDETAGRYVHVICDSEEVFTSADVVKAIACGADAVVLGRPLAIAEEAAAKGAFWTHASAHPRFPRFEVEGHMAAMFGDERIDDGAVTLETLLHGPSTAADGTQNFVGALKRAMGKCGYTDVKQFQKVALAVR